MFQESVSIGSWDELCVYFGGIGGGGDGGMGEGDWVVADGYQDGY